MTPGLGMKSFRLFPDPNPGDRDDHRHQSPPSRGQLSCQLLPLLPAEEELPLCYLAPANLQEAAATSRTRHDPPDGQQQLLDDLVHQQEH